MKKQQVIHTFKPNHSCERHHLAYLAADYHEDDKGKISAISIADSLRTGENDQKCIIMQNLFLIIHDIQFSLFNAELHDKGPCDI